MQEIELASYAVKYLQEHGFTIYQEVQCGSRIADIVGICGNISWVVETKKSASIAAIEQAGFWIYKSNFVSICTLNMYNSFSLNWLSHLGIGAMVLDMPYCIIEYLRPKLNRTKNSIKKYLREEQKTFAPAGNNNGSRWTPFQQTKMNIICYVKKNPRCSFHKMIDVIDTHYIDKNVAKSCLKYWIKKGVIPVVLNSDMTLSAE